MLIKFNCPHCQAALSVGVNFAGKKGGCPNCNEEVTIPKKSENTQKTTERAVQKR